MENLISLLVLASPAAFALTALVSWFQPGAKPKQLIQLSSVASLISILLAAISGFFVFHHSMLQADLIGFYGIGIGTRLDAISVIMFGMIALIGFIVLKFSYNYLDGDPRHGTFIGRLAAAIAAVQLLVLSGNLGLLVIAWILTSMSLHRLLVFYPERPLAIIAARKKFIMARIGDAFLLAAAVLLYLQFGTGNLETIFREVISAIAQGVPVVQIEAAAILLVLAALLKSAQFPTHGWLIEVMETPTPVSALLHAGLLNAGPFLILRMAHVVDAGSHALILLIISGGFTALFASVVYLTQTSVKTALSYSSVAHMGFSLMICGMGIYPAAMLHLVAHSFYKAHAFLSSGSAVESVRISKFTVIKRLGSPVRIVSGFILAFAIYAAFSLAWGMDPVWEFGLLAIGAIIVMGMSTLLVSALDAPWKPALLFRIGLLVITVAAAFFTLESMMKSLLAAQIPVFTPPGLTETIIITVFLSLFGMVVLLQLLAPLVTSKPAYQTAAIHLRNGLYANALSDRLVNALYTHSPVGKKLLVKVEDREIPVAVAEQQNYNGRVA
jgi:NAD(P)H-quinone oxidoreductase subunit 5